MSQPLHPCPACARHVFADTCQCPFCGAKLSPESCAKTAPPPGYRRMSRAARVAAGATLAGAAALLGCSSAYGIPPRDSLDATADAPQDAGTDGAAGRDGSSSDAVTDAGGGGGKSSPGSPPGTGGDRGVTPLYGGAPPGAGKTNG